jgi:RNA polymerase sigma factor (sigma-70 family)
MSSTKEGKIVYDERNERQLYKQELLKKFLAIREHQEVWHKFTRDPSPQYEQLLNKAFRKFIFQVRFLKYISTSIRYAAIDFDKRLNIIRNREQLILDQPLEDEERNLLNERWLKTNDQIVEESFFAISMNFVEAIEDPLIYRALRSLTDRQKLIVTLSFVLKYQDKEIADLLGVSQQSVSKTKKVAIEKIRKYLLEMNGGNVVGKL